MSRTTWILGNWKQNHLRAAAAQTATEVAAGLDAATTGARDIRVGLAPTFVTLETVAPHCADPDLRLFAQDVAAQENGAFTGEVGAEMLADVGVSGTIVGHSERRAYYGDNDRVVWAKLRSAYLRGLTVVLCCGESLAQRDEGVHKSTVISQLKVALSELHLDTPERLVVAYEPIWAIGTGRHATPEQASEMHGAIRAYLVERFAEAGAGRSILYGGSVKPSNAAELIAAPDIDGFLVGGASLDASAFLAIVRAASDARQE
jgi:triosephosphate isomerase